MTSLFSKHFLFKIWKSKIRAVLVWLLIFHQFGSCSKEDTKSSENKITSFQLEIDEIVYDGIINPNSGKITFSFEEELPSTLIPNIIFSEKATISPSEKTSQNFNNVIRYTVTAENGFEKTYTVVVENSSVGSSNTPPGPMEFVGVEFNGREMTIDWTDAADTDEITYYVYKNSIEIGQYNTSTAIMAFTYNQTEHITIFATDENGGTSELSFDIESPESELLFIRDFSGVLLGIDTKVKDVLWVNKSLSRFFSPPILNSNVITFREEGLIGLDILTGEQSIELNSYVPSQVLYNDVFFDDEVIYYRTETGLSAYNKDDYSKLWTANNLSYTSIPSLVHGDNLFCMDSRDHVAYALNKQTGEIIWSFTVENVFPGAFPTFNATPRVIGDELILSGGGYIYSLNTASGVVNWRVYHENLGSPSSISVIGDSLIAISRDKMFEIEKETGALIWVSTLPDYVSGTPFDFENRLYVGTEGNGTGSILAIDPSNGNVVWSRPVENKITGSPVVYDDKIYIADWDGILYCFNTQGDELWRIMVGNFVVSSPTLVKGNGKEIIYSKNLGYE